MYVKEEFVCGEVFSVGGHPCGPKTARTRFWTVLVLSDDDEDSESEDELRDRVYARGGEKEEQVNSRASDRASSAANVFKVLAWR